MVKIVEENKVAVETRTTGREASDNVVGVIISQIRMYLSTAFIREQSLCLLNRLCYLGEGARAAAVRSVLEVDRAPKCCKKKVILQLRCMAILVLQNIFCGK